MPEAGGDGGGWWGGTDYAVPVKVEDGGREGVVAVLDAEAFEVRDVEGAGVHASRLGVVPGRVPAAPARAFSAAASPGAKPSACEPFRRDQMSAWIPLAPLELR